MDNASNDIEVFFNQFQNTKRHNDIIKEAALVPNLLDNESDTFLEDDLNTNCVFAYIYPDSGEYDILNKNKFEDGNHVFTTDYQNQKIMILFFLLNLIAIS